MSAERTFRVNTYREFVTATAFFKSPCSSDQWPPSEPRVLGKTYRSKSTSYS